ncbi:unnamed protein product [Haemonchus placei]|uniref:HTH_48 domain-containing protein n=1 Tax=Haemonchus placei TaxID=6290 RepID=A0A0N4W357_HAEPC|nr:unnamed protein product [Haemonchus placei]
MWQSSILMIEKGWNVAELDLNELFGDGTVSPSQNERWLKRFRMGKTNLEDEEGTGRPDFGDRALLASVEQEKNNANNS